MARTVNGVTQDTITLTSTSVPAVLIPAGTLLAGWLIKAHEDNSVRVHVFLLNSDGTTPGVPPAQYWQLGAGSTLNDALTGFAAGADTTLNVGWAGVLESGSSAIVDVMYR